MRQPDAPRGPGWVMRSGKAVNCLLLPGEASRGDQPQSKGGKLSGWGGWV